MMLWPRRKRAEVPARSAAEIVPAALPIALDAGLFAQHLAQLHETLAPRGGVEPCLERLAAKQRLCGATLARAREQEIEADSVTRLLGYVFTARRHLLPALGRLGAQQCARLMRDLGDTEVPLVRRLQNFVDAMPGARTADHDDVRAAARVRRAAWDFAAEAAHYADPTRFPLMSRWVWDSTTQSGALREFVRGNDSMRELPFDSSAELFAGAGKWLAACVAEHGVDGDTSLWVDLVLAQAYTSYVRSIANGSLGGEFGRGAEAHEQLTKMLGIDTEEGRLRKAVMSDE